MSAKISLDDLADRTMGGCKLNKRIGKGAMGVVYLADQVDLQRKVAFKILDPKFSSDASYIERFEREARAAAQLNHPNIVKVYDFGSEGPLHFIVNEYIDGGTVQDILQEKKTLQPEVALEYALQVAKGLIAANERVYARKNVDVVQLSLYLGTEISLYI